MVIIELDPHHRREPQYALQELYFDPRRLDLEDMAKLRDYFQCSLGDLFETVRQLDAK